MTSSRFDYAQESKRTVLDLVKNLREDIFKSPQEDGDLNVVEFFFQRLHPERVIDHITTTVLPHKKEIDRRNVNFFLKKIYLKIELIIIPT